MELMIDIGNTHTVIGLFKKSILEQNWRLASQLSRTEDECWAVISSFLNIAQIEIFEIKGVCISSVVPNLSLNYIRMIEKYLKINPLLISHELDLGMKIIYQDPYSVGADRICNSVAGKMKYGSPLIIVDFGTATTIDCINQKGDYIGGIICPGIESTASVLHHKAAKLPKIDLNFPANVIGNNTEESMQSGIMFGSVKLIEGLIHDVKNELGDESKVIATGGFSSLIAEHTSYIDHIEEHLNLEGIYLIYKRNIT